MKPQRFFLLVLVLACGLVAYATRTTTLAQPAAPAVSAVETVGFTVSDMDRAVEFYTHVLTFEKIADTEVAGSEYEHLQGIFGLRLRIVRLRLGQETLELTEYLVPKGKPFPHDSRGNDRWFQHIAIVVNDMAKAYAWLRQHNVQHASTGPQRLPDWNPNAGGIEAFYFRDPDGHFLEILRFPPGKGDTKWHQAPAKLFLGIDHTAIVVGNTDDSLGFYRDALGLRIVGASENYGTEQEHLNNVFGARVRITSLRATAGPGIEFLEYLSPRDGRPFPEEAKANDLLHWQIRLRTADVSDTTRRLPSGRSTFLSSGVVSLPTHSLGFKKAALVRDPDGHAVQIVE